MIDSTIVDAQAERTSGRIVCTVVDEFGVPIPLASITSLTLTLYDEGTNQILNSRMAQNVLNFNDCSVSDGLINWAVSPADMVLAAQAEGQNEMHCAQFVLRWGGGSKEKCWQGRIPVHGFRRYP